MSKQIIATLLFIIMLAGLFWSRAILSISQGAWLLFALWQYKSWMPAIKKDPLFTWSCCPLALFLLGFYQQPMAAGNYDYLLTLSVYPVAALAARSTATGMLQKWSMAIQCAALIGLLYPVGWYFLHTQEAFTAYGSGQSLPTFMDTDHVRFGIFVCCALLFALVATKKKTVNYIIVVTLAVSIIFLSVRSAWAILITMSVLLAMLSKRFASRNTFSPTGIQPTRAFHLFILFAAIAAYFVFPTVQQKIAYTIFDWHQFKPTVYDPDFSDGARRAINYTSWKAATDGNGSNTGWAAIPTSLQYAFTMYFPGYTLKYGWPFNQWLFWWMGSGWWGMLLFSAWLFYPVIWGWKHKNAGLICWTAGIAISCIPECTLAYQYGVWLHAWPVALLWAHQHKQTGHFNTL